MGKKVKNPIIYASSTDFYTRSDQEIANSVLSIIPNITFKALSKPSYHIYTRLGVAIALQTKLEMSGQDSSINKFTPTVFINVGQRNFAYKFKPGTGVQSSLGIQFRITEKLKVMGELAGFYLASNPTTYTVTTTSKQTQTNPVIPPFYTKSTTTITFSSSGQENRQNISGYGSGTSASDPRFSGTIYNAPTDTKNFNYLGVNIGVALAFKIISRLTTMK